MYVRTTGVWNHTKYMLLVIVLSFTALVGCSMLADLGMSALSPDKGGINTELVVGDKNQVLGTSQKVKASSIGKVVGTSDNSTAVASAQKVIVTNIDIPKWLIAVLLVMAMAVGVLFPRPKAWKQFINRNNT